MSIARSLAVDPAVIFLDEPMASLDPPTRRGLLADLERIFRSLSTAVVWVTHDTEEALAVADVTTFLVAGEIVQHGPTTHVFNQPASHDVADYLGLDTWFEGVVEETDKDRQRFVLPGGASLLCTGAPAGPAVAAVHPEDVLLYLQPPVAADADRNVIEATVSEVQTSGRTSRIVLDWAAARLEAAVTRAASEDLDIRPGQTVYATVRSTAIRILPRSGREEGS